MTEKRSTSCSKLTLCFHQTSFLVYLAIGLFFGPILPKGSAQDAIDFDRQIAPLLASRCLECHNASDLKGELDLSRKSTVFRSDEPVITPGDLEASPLWTQVHEDSMPPKKSLKESEKELLRKWIQQGAKWGQIESIDRFAWTSDTRAGADWWSLQPVKRPQIPSVKIPSVKTAGWGRNPIDAFVLEKLEAKGLTPAPAADRRTLIRRVYFDLLGLPPSPNDIDTFINDPAPNAYERLVDRLLESKHYGERWARHWLDVARYTESQGFEYDRFRPNAWHYRDYVIQSLNEDKPYNIFLQEQIAGDVQNFAHPNHPVSSEGMVATSLLVCGPWDQAGNAQANVTQKKITREEELEDLVSVIGQTFLGMTVNCARCHSHKFDPIPQQDYFRLKAVFEGVRHGERSIESPADETARKERLANLEAEIALAEKTISKIELEGRNKALEGLQAKSPTTKSKPTVTPYAHWNFEENANDSMGSMHGELLGGATLSNGRLIVQGKGQYLKTSVAQIDIAEKTLAAWVALDSLEQGGGGVLTLESDNGAFFDSIVYGERQPRKWIAGSNGFTRTQDLVAPSETVSKNELVHIAVVYRADQTIALYRNGRLYAEPYKASSLQRFLSGSGYAILGLRHTGAGNGFFAGEIESASLYNVALREEDILSIYAAGPKDGPIVSRDQMMAALSESQKQELANASQRKEQLRQELKQNRQPSLSYIGLRQQPEPTHRLVRGDVLSQAEVVSPAGLSTVRQPSGDFGLAPDAPEAERRIQLAKWLASSENPLTARVMVNRLWHYHFGRGIVETPNDFGFNGSRPTHPELLDWLADEFVHGPNPWSLKKMHRMILTSATYQQSSVFNSQAAAIDADNALLWRFAPRRLEGEIVRDAMLAVSGELNPQMGGPSFMPFKITSFNSDFYQPIDPIGPEFNRRTIYRANINSGKSAMMDSLDCPDPSIKTPSRRVTTTPLAALALMNNSFVQRQAACLARRITTDLGSEETKPTEPSQASARSITLAYMLCFGRSPSIEESQNSRAFVEKHGTEAFCWALLNATEFMYIN